MLYVGEEEFAEGFLEDLLQEDFETGQTPTDDKIARAKTT